MKAIMPLWPCPALDAQQRLARSSTSNQRQALAATAFPGPLSPGLLDSKPVLCAARVLLLSSDPTPGLSVPHHRTQEPGSLQDHSPRLSSRVDLSSDGISFPMVLQQWLKPYKENKPKLARFTKAAKARTCKKSLS